MDRLIFEVRSSVPEFHIILSDYYGELRKSGSDLEEERRT
jgi:hypothetical protein